MSSALPSQPLKLTQGHRGSIANYAAIDLLCEILKDYTRFGHNLHTSMSYGVTKVSIGLNPFEERFSSWSVGLKLLRLKHLPQETDPCLSSKWEAIAKA
ncbi:MAG: hypothetical protein AAFZ11_04245 [Pseudomonadota bacterium]